MTRKQKEIIETIHCEYYFTPEELQNLGQQLVQTMTKINGLQNDLQAIKEDFKGKIALQESHRDCFHNNVETRREMRPTRCRVEFYPKLGNKEYYNCVTGKLEKVDAMTPSDFNLELFEKEELKPDKPMNPVIDETRQITATSESHQVIDAEIILPPHQPEEMNEMGD